MGRRILIIEDDPTNLELTSYVLKMFGYTILEAADGETGLALARREKPDLVLCDIQLPGMSGYEVARQIRADADLRSVPLVAVTAYAMASDRAKALRAGFNAHVPKPIDPDAFVQQVATLLPPGRSSRPTTLAAHPVYETRSSRVWPSTERS